MYNFTLNFTAKLFILKIVSDVFYYIQDWRNIMANILPVSDLRNYNEVLKNCHVGEPVFLTKNGRGRFVVMDIEDYERDKAERKLLMMLQEAEDAVKDEKEWMTLEEVKSKFGV